MAAEFATRATSAKCTDDELVVMLSDGRTLSMRGLLRGEPARR
jgi:hypothetical protein